MMWRMPSASFKNLIATTPKLLDRGTGSVRTRSRTGLRISKSRTYPHGWPTPGGDEERKRRRLYNQSLSMFMITTLVPDSMLTPLIITLFVCG